MASKATEGFGFIIKTNEYAGNFEREMCAFITGAIGECEVGEEFVDPKITALFEENIMQVPDDNGTHRPCSIHCDTGNHYNNVVIYFEQKPTIEQRELMKERAKLFNEAYKNEGEWNKDSKIEILGFELEEYNRKIIKHEA